MSTNQILSPPAEWLRKVQVVTKEFLNVFKLWITWKLWVLSDGNRWRVILRMKSKVKKNLYYIRKYTKFGKK